MTRCLNRRHLANEWQNELNEHRRGAALMLALVLVMVIGVAVSTLMLTLRHRADRTLQHQWNTQAELIALAAHQSDRVLTSITLDDTTSPEWSGVTVAVLNDRVELRRGEVLLAASPITPNTAPAANRNEVSE